MKSLILATLLLVIHTATFAQERNVVLVMNQTINGSPFTLNSPQESGTSGQMFKLTRLEYYVSGIQIVHDGGQIKSISDLYLLVHPSTNNRFNLGMHMVNQIEGIRFSIGVDPGRNHADPATYPASHPLALKNPSMHWGWSAGYRFIALEGFSGPSANMLTTNFQIHALGDELYKPVQITTPAVVQESELVITIQADYKKALQGIDISQGPINHSGEGEALVLMQNFGALVFTAGATSGIQSEVPSKEELIHAYPNPSIDLVTIQSSFPNNTPVVLTDMLGRTAATTVLENGIARFTLSGFPAGLYAATATDGATYQSVCISLAR